MFHLSILTPFRFRVALAVVLGVAFASLQLAANVAPSPTSPPAWQHDGRLHVFFHPDCPHCHEAIEFLKAQPAVDFVLHDVSTPANEALLLMLAHQHGIGEGDLGVPLFVRGTRFLIGFESAETTGRELLALSADEAAIVRPDAGTSRIKLPLFGEIDPSRYSLLALSVLMGLSDGFNPCAMWVLVYLISLIAGIQDQRKVWWLVGTFVLASGILYFLFMTAWLNTFRQSYRGPTFSMGFSALKSPITAGFARKPPHFDLPAEAVILSLGPFVSKPPDYSDLVRNS
jgi:hypothetical protein